MLSKADFEISCQATSGASESRQGAPKSRLSARASAASSRRGGCSASTSRSSRPPKGSGPSTIKASTEYSRKALSQSLMTPSTLTLSKLAGYGINRPGKEHGQYNQMSNASSVEIQVVLERFLK